MTFLDTNILVYAADDTDRAKFDAACAIVFKAAGCQNVSRNANILA